MKNIAELSVQELTSTLFEKNDFIQVEPLGGDRLVIVMSSWNGLALALIGFAVAVAKLRLSSVPFLIIIGMVVGPHAPQVGILDFIQPERSTAFLSCLSSPVWLNAYARVR